MPETTTARSKRYLEKQGWTVTSGEKTMRAPAKGGHPCPVCHVPKMMVWKVDTFSFGDLIAIHPERGIMLVQTTTTPNSSARVNKILGIPEADIWLKAGGSIQVHGWQKEGHRWIVTVTDIGLDKDFPGTMQSKIQQASAGPLFDSVEHEPEEAGIEF